MKRVVLTIAGVVDARGAQIGIQRISEARVRRSFSRILDDNVLCSMATVCPNGRAHINTAYFSFTRNFELYFLSHPDSTHCCNLAANSSMAMAVFSSKQSWAGPDRGLQLFGTCRQARGAQLQRAATSYGERFRKYAMWKSRLELDDPAREYRLYRFVPKHVKVFDEKAFGEAVVRIGIERRTSNK